jgi:hypothetical protein
MTQIEVLSSPSGAGAERGAEAIDCCRGVCIRRIGLRGGPARGCGVEPYLSLAPGASNRRGGIRRGGCRAAPAE